MDIPLVSLPGVFWQRAFASVENIMLPPWYIHGEAGFSLGPLEEKNPWLGGYPFEVAKPEEIFDFFAERNFVLKRLKTCGGGIGCNEFVFKKSS